MSRSACPVRRIGSHSKRHVIARKVGFASGTALGGFAAIAALGFSPAALAQSCGGATSGTVTCTAAGNPYAAGITITPTADLTLIINPDVVATNSVTVIGNGLTHVINNGTITTTGAGDGFGGGAGIGASGTTGVIVDGTGSVTTGGVAANGVTARSLVSGDVTVKVGNVTTTGANANGIFGYATGASNVVITSTGTVSATGGGGTGNIYGVYGTVQGGSGAVTINANTVAVGGGNATGISAKAQGGPINVTFGTVKSDGGGLGGAFGVRARSYGGGNVTVSGANVATTDAFAYGVFADSNNGDPAGTNTGAVSVTTTGQVSTTGTQVVGIGAFAQGGPANVTVNNVSTTGYGAVGVIASSATGPASVTVNGTVTAAGISPAEVRTDGIDINGGTTAALMVASGGLVSGTSNAVTITSATGSSVNNAGTLNSSATGYAIQAVGGPATITNSGTINGRILLNGNNNAVTNSGIFNANADSNFGPGTNTFNNSGTFAVLPGSAAAGTVTLTGLSSFNNSGTVTLVNGHTGDRLVVPGTFNGGGGRLAVDIAFGNAGTASTSDQLVVNGAITGSTGVVVNAIGPNGGILNPGVTFATGGAGTSVGGFTLGSPVNNGFLNYGVAYNPAANSFSLVVTPGDAVFRNLKINEGAQQLWYKSADAWSAHMSDLRDSHSVDATTGTGRLWGQFYGGTDARRSTRSFTTFGQTRDVRTSYSHDAFGGQLGLDLGTIGRGGTAVFGITGGYVNSDLKFRASVDRVNYSEVNGGAYVNLVSHGLFFNALGKYDYSWIYSTSPFAGYATHLHGQSYGAQGELGFRIGADALYIEPVASAAYVRTDLNNLNALGSTVDFNKLDGLRGKAGARVGSRREIAGGALLQLYAQGNYVHEFMGTDGIRFANGGTTLSYGNDRIPDYGEAKIGFSVASRNGVTGFAESFGDYSRAYKGVGGRAGLRVKF